MGCAWRTRPVTCSANVGRTASIRAPICVVTITPSGRPIRESWSMTPLCRECRSPALRRTRCRRPTLSTRRIRSPTASGLSILVGADEAVPVSVPQLSLPPLRVQLCQRVALRRLDDAGQLAGEGRVDRHVAHPFVVVPIKLAKRRDLELEACALEVRPPLLECQRPDMGRVAPNLHLVEHLPGGRRWGAIDEGRISVGLEHAERL